MEEGAAVGKEFEERQERRYIMKEDPGGKEKMVLRCGEAGGGGYLSLSTFWASLRQV